MELILLGFISSSLPTITSIRKAYSRDLNEETRYRPLTAEVRHRDCSHKELQTTCRFN